MPPYQGKSVMTQPTMHHANLSILVLPLALPCTAIRAAKPTIRPEPYEYLESAGKMKLERVASTAAHK